MTLEVPAADPQPTDPEQPVKRGRGRPPGSKNKKKKRKPHTKEQMRGLISQKPGTPSHNPNIGNIKDGYMYSRYGQWREKMKAARRKTFTQKVVMDLFAEAIDIAMDKQHPDRARMLEFCIEQCVGKASSKLEMEVSHEHGLSIDQKLDIFKAITGLAKPQTTFVSSVPFEQLPDADGSGDGDPLDRVGVPRLPAPVDLRPEQVQDREEAGSLRVDVLP